MLGQKTDKTQDSRTQHDPANFNMPEEQLAAVWDFLRTWGNPQDVAKEIRDLNREVRRLVLTADHMEDHPSWADRLFLLDELEDCFNGLEGC